MSIEETLRAIVREELATALAEIRKIAPPALAANDLHDETITTQEAARRRGCKVATIRARICFVERERLLTEIAPHLPTEARA